MRPPHVWHGEGDPLVLIAGLGAKGTSWHPFLPIAARHYRVLTFDNRGSGRAAPAPRDLSIRDLAEDALRLLDWLGIDRAPVVGRSMGGMIAQELALLAPDRVERLVLASTTGRVDRHLAEIFTLSARMAEQGVPAELRHRNSMLWCLGAASLAREEDARTYLRARDAGDRPEDYAHQARACAAHDALKRLKGLEIPTLLICGDDDRLTPPAHAKALAEAIPGARLVAIPGVGHLAYLEAPRRFAGVVLEFLSQGRREVTCPRASTAS